MAFVASLASKFSFRGDDPMTPVVNEMTPVVDYDLAG